MLAFPTMITQAAADAGIAVPADPDHFETEEFPRFYLFCCAQLGRPMQDPGAHWANAKVIAAIPEDEIKTVTFEALIEKGWTL